jgi:hypothetical protein
MAIMYTYVARSSIDGNLSVVGSAKKTIGIGVAHIRDKISEIEDETIQKRLLDEVEKLDVKELAKTVRDEGRVNFGVSEIDGLVPLTILCEKFHLG